MSTKILTQDGLSKYHLKIKAELAKKQNNLSEANFKKIKINDGAEVSVWGSGDSIEIQTKYEALLNSPIKLIDKLKNSDGTAYDWDKGISSSSDAESYKTIGSNLFSASMPEGLYAIPCLANNSNGYDALIVKHSSGWTLVGAQTVREFSVSGTLTGVLITPELITKLNNIQSNATKVAGSSINGNIKINGTETTVYTLPEASKTIRGGVLVDDALSSTSTNPVQNAKVNAKFNELTSGISANLTAINNLQTGKVSKENKTGSTTEYKVLSDNNFSNTYKNKIDNLKSVATSGSYNDLSNKPTIPSAAASIAAGQNGYATGTQVASFVTEKIATAISTVYKPKGSCAFSDLPHPSDDTLGFVYSVINNFTTDNRFIDGPGKTYPGGTNVVCVVSSGTFAWDVLAGAIDLSGYVQKTDLVAITDSEIDALFN